MSKSVTIKDIPKEVFFTLFKHLSRSDVYECQKVCRSWYLPAHLLFLQEVVLINNSEVESFLTSVVDNPLYLKSIKQIQLGDPDGRSWIDKEHSQQLLTQVPVKVLMICNSKTLIDLTRGCSFLSKSCPYLEKVHCFSSITAINTYYCQLVSELKDSLRHVRLVGDGTIEFLSGFHQLQELDINLSFGFYNFQAWLPLFEQRYTLKKINGRLFNADKTDFLETYLASRQASRIVQKLSQLKTLVIEEDNCFCSNSIQFMTRYFSGLEEFCYSNNWVADWNDLQQRLFCDDFLDFCCRLQTYDVRCWRVSQSIFSHCLATVFDKVWRASPPHVQRIDKVLQIHMFHDGANVAAKNFSCPYGLYMKSSIIRTGKIKRTVEVALGGDQASVEPVKSALKRNHRIDTFVFDFFHGDYYLCYDCPPIYLSVFEQMLNILPDVQKIVLDIPAKFNHRCRPKRRYPEVTHLELNACLEILSEETMDVCMWLFPNLSYLKLHYFSGIWRDDLSGFVLPLHSFSLERLSLDATPILIKTRKTFEGQKVQTDVYFVLAVQTATQRHLYKVSLEHLRIVKINSIDIEAFVNSQEHVCIRVYVAELEFLDLYLYRHILSRGHHVDYMESCKEDIMEAKITL